VNGVLTTNHVLFGRGLRQQHTWQIDLLGAEIIKT
jgi:hypothetical protein